MADAEFGNLNAHDAQVNAKIRDKTPSDRVSVIEDATLRRKLAATVFNNKAAIDALSAPSAPDLIIENNTVTTGDQAGTAGKLHVLTIAGLTAERAFTLPVAANVATGERVGVYIADGDGDYEITVKTGAAGDEIRGTDHSSTEFTRLFIAGEYMVFRCLDGSTADWMVEVDRRIPCMGGMKLSANFTTHSSGAWVTIPNNTSLHNVGDIVDTSNNRINLRRDGLYLMTASYAPINALSSGNAYYIGVLDSSVAIVQNVTSKNYNTSQLGVCVSTTSERTAGTYLRAGLYCGQSNIGAAAADHHNFTATEVL